MKTAVKDVMTTRVVWVKQGASFKEMAVALRENRVSAFPVLHDDGKVIGVVSVGPGETVEHAARLMYTHNVKRLPVTDANGHLLGIGDHRLEVAVLTASPCFPSMFGRDRPSAALCLIGGGR
jgi:CBS domain-containing protein